MRERLFPRWGAALFALLPLSELLYLPVDGQTMYAAALASLVCALLCAGGARIAPFWCRYRILQWALALFALWPLTQSLARMGLFLRNTVFPARPLWSLILLLTVCTLLTATTGLNRCAMWALPVAWAAGAVLALSGILTLGELRISYWEAPAAPLLAQAGASAAQAEKIAWLIAHHHSFDASEDLAFRILLEADFLVNAYESALPPEACGTAGERVFRTETGRSFLQKMYLEKPYKP